MAILNLDALAQTPLRRDPFDFVVVQGFLHDRGRQALDTDFPRIPQPGLFPVSRLRYGPAFDALVSELQGPGLTAAMSKKLGADLTPYPTLVTVRGQCRERDGQIHTDSTWKVVSALLYLNEDWQGEGGRLRLLRSPSLEDFAVEVPPEWGTFLAFRRSDRSFHGHKPFDGARRMIQVNWCTDQRRIDKEIARHRRSARVKRWFSVGAAYEG